MRPFFGLKIWVDCDEQVRMARLHARPAPSPGWLDVWLAGERFYGTHDRPAASADLMIRT